MSAIERYVKDKQRSSVVVQEFVNVVVALCCGRAGEQPSSRGEGVGATEEWVRAGQKQEPES